MVGVKTQIQNAEDAFISVINYYFLGYGDRPTKSKEALARYYFTELKQKK